MAEAAAQGRVKQRRRTRRAILEAAIDLLEQGEEPSVAEIADAADVSRRTVYQYFPTLDQLLIDAALGALTRSTIDPQLQPTSGDAPASTDVAARVDALIRSTWQTMTPETERQGRTLLRLTVEARQDDPDIQRRGYRRVEWIETALEPVRETLEPADFERLVSALAMLFGWEAVLVLKDVRGLDLAEAEEVSAWAARAVVSAALGGSA